MGRVLGRFWEGFGKVWEPFGRSGGLPKLFCSCFGTFLGCLGIFSMLLVNFWLFLLFVVSLGCCGMFFLSVACWGWFFCVLLSAGFLGAIGTSQRVLDRFYLVFSTSSRREARAQRASRGTKEGRVERKSGKMRKRLSLSLPGFFFCSSRSLLSIVFSLRRL